MPAQPKIAYLFSRYPIASQTFCDSEMLALEAAGVPLCIGSLNAPPDSFRHERLANIKANAHYPPPAKVLQAMQKFAEADGSWAPLAELVAAHDKAYGTEYKANLRARNALYFCRLFRTRGVSHVHVHFANRATHTALFLKKLGLPFSFTAHAQDFMVDLGSRELLAEMCREAEFVIAVSDFSKRLLQDMCPDSKEKIHRVYNGIETASFPVAPEAPAGEPLKIIAIGRLIEFKGFHHLLGACAKLRDRGIPFECTIAGDGPWLERLSELRAGLKLTKQQIILAGRRSHDELKAALADSHVFALPSIVDSKGASDILPTVIMEAMAAALPVVSTKLVGIPEMVDDGETGILVEPENEDALADALGKLAADPGLRARYGAAGKVVAGERFELEKTCGHLRQFFEEKAQPANPVAGEQLIYLINEWPPPQHLFLHEETALAIEDPNFLPISANLHHRYRKDDPLATHLEFLPDGIVLEAEWRANPEYAAKLEVIRNELGTAVSGELFFKEARRALRLIAILEKRDIPRIHFARSDGALCAWLVKKLTGCKLSGAIEEHPRPGQGLLSVLAPDFDLVSVSDAELAAVIKASTVDHLKLQRPITHRRIGPFRIRNRLPAPGTDTARAQYSKRWFSRILGFS
ncbi:MAG: glycosyltransferase involved in cell wall biosynthesis [Verrucomicrobiales bacterium]|jgi:glycosyltransferase involved in cell wall biosynthesis